MAHHWCVVWCESVCWVLCSQSAVSPVKDTISLRDDQIFSGLTLTGPAFNQVSGCSCRFALHQVCGELRDVMGPQD